MASASRSNTLIAYQRARSAGAASPTMACTFCRADSTSGEKHLTPLVATPSLAASTACRMSLSRFLLRSAETSTTGAPSMEESFFASITSPRSFSRSHMLSPTTTGRPASSTCVVR